MTDNRNPLVRLWTGFWRLLSWVRIITVNLLFLLIVYLIFRAIFTPEEFDIPDEGPLLVTPSGYLVDQKSYQSPTRRLMEASSQRPAETLVRDLVDSIVAAAEDERVTALVLELDYLTGAHISKLEEVGAALQTFKDSGKPVIAYADNYTQAQYYLASYADEIYLNELGGVLLTGFSMYQHYMREGIEKLDVDINVFRAGEYKDFIEPFTRNSMSSSSREHNSRWVNELWGVYASRIETGRQLPAGAINSFINNMNVHLREVGGDVAQLALDHGLVDQVVSRVAIHEQLMDRFGLNEHGDSFKAIAQRPYLNQLRFLDRPKPNQVALIVASGNILDGEQPTGSIGSDTMTRLIRQAREDEAVKALVVRVDSGGGSAFASEVIRQELAAMRDEGKPVVISMGSLAASGGYWISLPADEIWATPTTLTGSIGVFGIFPTFQETLEGLGVHLDGIGTTDLAGSERVDRALPEEAAEIAQANVEFIYRRFIGLVAAARDQEPDQVHEVGQGRIWTGASAAELGLVDHLGYLQDAIAAAATIAGLDDYSVELVQRELTPTEQIMRALSGEANALLSRVTDAAMGSTVERTGLLAEHENIGRFREQLKESLAPLLNARQNGVYAHCLHCGRL